MTGGMAYEALNNLGHSGGKVLIVLNDNGRSYAPTVGSPSARPGREPSEPRALRGVLCRRRSGGSQGYASAPRGRPGSSRPWRALRRPVDGHDIAVGRRCGDGYDGPVVVHVLTQKGRGYAPAEDDDEKCLHDAPVFDPTTGPPRGRPRATPRPSPTPWWSPASATRASWPSPRRWPAPPGCGPFQDRWPDRFLDVGIAEQHAVTAAAGLAMGGHAPGGGHLLDVPQPGLRPGQPRRRAPPPPRGPLRRPGRHHRRRRPLAPRRARHGAAARRSRA